jgi:hypothetical protein
MRPPPTVPEGCVAIFNSRLSAEGEWRIELVEAELGEVGVKERAAPDASAPPENGGGPLSGWSR